MQNNDHHIDKLFKSNLAGFSEQPPPAVWDNISASLDLTRSRKRKAWLWTMAGAASLTLAFTVGWLLSEKVIDNEIQRQLQLIKSELSEQVIISSPLENSIQLNSGFNRPKKLMPELLNAPVDSKLNEREVKEEQQPDLLKFAESKNFDFPERKPDMNDFEPVLKNKQHLSDVDRAIIEANLLAMNNSTEKPSRQTAWSLGLKASPFFMADQPSLGNAEMMQPDYNLMRNTIETEYKPIISGGVSVEFNTGKRLSFVSGINYNEVSQGAGGVAVAFTGHDWINRQLGIDYLYGEEVKSSVDDYQESNAVFQTTSGLANLNMSPGTELASISKNNIMTAQTIQNFDYLHKNGYIEIPLLMRYLIMDKVIGIHLLGGLNTNILISNNAILSNRGGIVAQGDIEGIKPLVFSSSIGMGLNYDISGQLNISLEPTLKVYMNSLNSFGIFGSKPYSVGVFSGISYRF
jgi:hypothetical protein